MDDLISRQAAIDAVLSVIPYDEYWKEQVEIAVNNLPSAQPDCTDCIKNGGDWNCDHVHCHKGISIQPEIIRCKDCKHWIPYDWMFSEVWQSKNIADYHEDEIGCNYCDMPMKANDFCSLGERKNDERSNQQTGAD